MTGIEIITAYVLIAGLLASFGLGCVAGHERMRRQARTIRRLSRSVETLAAQLDETEADLTAERVLVARLSKPAADLLADVRGAHHRQEEADRG